MSLAEMQESSCCKYGDLNVLRCMNRVATGLETLAC